MSPPLIACRICRSIEGKLKNYTDNAFVIKAYEEFSGCPFIELPYLTKFCPECASLIRKVYKFRRKCRKSYKFLTEHLNTGRKITRKFIEMTGASLYHKPNNLSTWEGYHIPTIDYVYNPKAQKTKKKSAEKVVFHIKHVTVPKDPQAEIPTIVPETTYDFKDSFNLEEELYGKLATISDKLDTNAVSNSIPNVLDTANVLGAPVNLIETRDVSETPVDLEAVVVETNMQDSMVDGDPTDILKTTSVSETPLCDGEIVNEESELDVKMEDEMSESDENLDVKLESEPDLDQDNLTLQEIKEEILGATGMGINNASVEKGDKIKKTGRKKEKQYGVTKKKLQVQARRNRSNQELEEHFTITQFLTEEEQMHEFLKRKQGEGYLEGKFKCELCLKSFKEQKWMDAHVKKHEPPAGAHVCPICQIRSRTPKLYRTHRDCNHTTRYACRRCPFVTYSKAQALKHHGWHEGVEHACQHCGATFRKHTTYMGHLRRAHPSAHICGYCARSFVSAYGLNLHIKAVHKDINKLENDSTRCEECDVTFVSRQMYVRHLLITDKHKDMSKDILGCRKCGEQFETKEDMEKHTHYKERQYVRKDAPRRNIKCDECSEVFSHPNGVYQHYLREHPDTPYKFAVRRHYLCEQCGKTFKSPGLLQQHSLSHLGLRPAPAKKPPAARNCCRLCGKTYSKLSGLFRHKLTHMGVRRHKCHICEKAFTDTSNLKQHVQGVHLNIRRIRKR